jgi:hypothetical protein
VVLKLILGGVTHILFRLSFNSGLVLISLSIYVSSMLLMNTIRGCY